MTSLRVLISHNRYQIRGGEDAVVEGEAMALARAGCRVETVLVSNDTIDSPVARLRVAIEAAHAPRGIARVLEAVRDFRPDVVHVHNTFPLVSPAVHAAVRAVGPATVQTLHNYRIVCAGALLLRDGRPCEDCIAGTPYAAAVHGCYRGSRIGSLAVAHMIAHHRRVGTWKHDVDAFIALTGFARDRFARAGVPAERIFVKPNGLADPGPVFDGPRQRLLYAGRLSPEKGLSVLAQAAAQAGLLVDVAGDGPMRSEVAAGPWLVPHGALAPAETQAAIARARALVVPSLWYEGLPMVIIEAFAAGTPVIASRIGSLAELVEDGVTGLLVEPDDPGDLARALRRISGDPAEARRMGRAGRAVYEQRWAEPITTKALISVYRAALASRFHALKRAASDHGGRHGCGDGASQVL
ncbi:glycosyltransferase family 4 protein [Methylobacterium sp. WL6]|uniref:glycosyltransferase family 4 protein n=1 Tax=Methylobacterium sp. WL6 TaxID=2603901 RepID=UPI0011CC034D|nr:glycosyltransferase family 4 protein [Methylobacterium sp. WL6]TXN71600.1 glycosyltransferase family 4 protein [Methylobacterium sp. WL6]